MSDIGIEWLGDRALLLRLGAGIDSALNARVHAVARALRAAQLPGVVDIVPAYASVAVHYDPLVWNELESAQSPGEQLAQRVLETALFSGGVAAPTPSEESRRVVEIPVCYGGEHGPDLAEVARLAGLDEREVVGVVEEQLGD